MEVGWEVPVALVGRGGLPELRGLVRDARGEVGALPTLVLLPLPLVGLALEPSRARLTVSTLLPILRPLSLLIAYSVAESSLNSQKA